MKTWTEEEENFVYKNQGMSNKIIAQKLGKTEMAISSKKHKLSHQKIKGAKKGVREDRKLDFLVSLLIVKNRNIKHENTVNGCMEAVKAGCLEDIKIKII